MDAREWALILFTLLMQMAAGSFLTLRIFQLYAARAGAKGVDRLMTRALVAVLVAVAVGLLASLFHLGEPLGAYRAVKNLGSSWLSLEILLSLLFALGLVGYGLLQRRPSTSQGAREAIGWVTALLGLGSVYAMSQVYRLRTVPVWDTVATPVAFFSTALLLGLLFTAVLLVANTAALRRTAPEQAGTLEEPVRAALRATAVAALLLLGVELAVAPFWFALAQGTAAGAGAHAGSAGVMLGVRLALAIVGAGVLPLFFRERAAASTASPSAPRLVYTAFVLVLASEVVGRFLFYATYTRLGV